jgi:hypothetical protein
MSALPPKADITHSMRVRLVGPAPRRNSSGSLAIFAAIRRASSLVSNFAADRRPGSFSK